MSDLLDLSWTITNYSHHPLDEANPKGTRQRYLFPIARGGARAKGPVCCSWSSIRWILTIDTSQRSLPLLPAPTPQPRSTPRPRISSSLSDSTLSQSTSPTLLLSFPDKARDDTSQVPLELKLRVHEGLYVEMDYMTEKCF